MNPGEEALPAGAWDAPHLAAADIIGSSPNRRTMLWFGGAAAGVLVVGLVMVLVMLVNGSLGHQSDPFAGAPAAGRDDRPALARLCPPPSQGAAAAPGEAEPAPAGPRTVDQEAGISYRAYGEPWRPWPLMWRGGTLGIPYGVGQHFVTERYSGGDYHASILSAAVPATVNDSLVIDLTCTGRLVAADVRTQYYPQPNRMDLLRDELTTLGGRPAWVTKFRLHFHQQGLEATDELVAVALIDVGRPTAAVLYVSIPGTHHQWDYVVDDVLTSVRPT
jgi:hypothetical protein